MIAFATTEERKEICETLVTSMTGDIDHNETDSHFKVRMMCLAEAAYLQAEGRMAEKSYEQCDKCRKARSEV